ncbi:chemotaxis protein CheW [Clostridium sp. OS1-26]|uniref:chemotaxis protein CheW n=1 Tax=Clostridium sp. OS1-26 TaxID=3070681 RepID=UPI0027DEBCB1|nr:chemotaxis protein CheW [Clostridium sp. OS1-26]WML37607.1 chemotaxis protein CheW [Clostridium sp. OS1-26]
MNRYDSEKMSESIEIIEFLLNNNKSSEKYAIEVLYVSEVHSVRKVTMLPCTPAFIIGIINFRGKIISVVDIRNFLGFSSEPIDAENVRKAIVVKLNDIEIGIAADAILGCDKICTSEIQKNALPSINFKNSHIKGLTKGKSIVLDIKNIMMDEKIIVNEEVV